MVMAQAIDTPVQRIQNAFVNDKSIYIERDRLIREAKNPFYEAKGIGGAGFRKRIDDTVHWRPHCLIKTLFTSVCYVHRI